MKIRQVFTLFGHPIYCSALVLVLDYITYWPTRTSRAPVDDVIRWRHAQTTWLVFDRRHRRRRHNKATLHLLLTVCASDSSQKLSDVTCAWQPVLTVRTSSKHRLQNRLILSSQCTSSLVLFEFNWFLFVVHFLCISVIRRLLSEFGE